MTTRERILNEATRQLLELGYSAFTMVSVRDALGLSSGSMFHAFESKPALVAEIYVEGMRRYQSTAIEALTSTPDPVAAVESLVETHLCWVRDNRELARFLFSTQPDEVIDAAAPTLTDANTVFFSAVESVLDAAVEAGVMAPLPPGVGHSVLMGAVQEYCRQWTRGTTTVDPGDLVGVYQRVAVAAMRATLEPEHSNVRV
ncbi:MAG: TetR/AcrR family transcriptional regulator [Acidimicrobiales bacterium]